jgi:uncharacterized membrane protein
MLRLVAETEPVQTWIGAVAMVLEVFAVAIIALGTLYAGVRFVLALRDRERLRGGYSVFKAFIGRTLLLGLEVLVAADVIRTVALEPTLQNVGVLGILVLIRTFLSWSLVVELEERWPWQAEKVPPPGPGLE